MRVFAAMALGAVLCAPAFAQDGEAAAGPPVSASVEAPAVPPAPTAILAPKLTPVTIRLVDPAGSNFSQPGDSLAIAVDRDVAIAGVVVIPEGTPGVGEVLHAKKSGGSGTGGELIVLANYLELDGRRIPLRSLQMTGTGRNRDIETAVVTQLVGPFGLMVKGRPITFEIGYTGVAKLAEDTEFAAPAAPAAATIVPAAPPEELLAAPAGPVEELQKEGEIS